MRARLFVANLPYDLDEDTFSAFLDNFGVRASSVKIIRDKETGNSRGFGFIEVDDAKGAAETITLLNGATVGQRKIVVQEANPREQRGRP